MLTGSAHAFATSKPWSFKEIDARRSPRAGSFCSRGKERPRRTETSSAPLEPPQVGVDRGGELGPGRASARVELAGAGLTAHGERAAVRGPHELLGRGRPGVGLRLERVERLLVLPEVPAREHRPIGVPAEVLLDLE